MARMLTNGGAVDPFMLQYAGDSFRDPAGRVLVHPAPVAGETNGVFITAGQSNGVGGNFVDTKYTITETTKNHNLNFWDGGVYTSKDQMLGGGWIAGFGGGSYGGRLADKMIVAGMFDRVIMVPLDHGGASIASWTPAGDLLFTRLIVATRRVLAAGHTVSAYLWHQGETDNTFNTSQATYTAALNSIIAGVRAFGADFQAPWFIGTCSYISGATDSNITNAQAAVVSGGTDVYAGADTDTLTGTTVNRLVADDTHFKAAGADAAADLWKTALDVVF